VSAIGRFLYAICKAVINYLPVMMGTFLFASACLGYGNPPVKRYIRLLVGGMGFLLIYVAIHRSIASREYTFIADGLALAVGVFLSLRLRNSK
jgi:hypothetical protein